VSDAVLRSNEEIAGYYDYMGAFFALLFGKSNHMGLWEEGDDSPVSDAQDRLTQVIIDATGLTAGQRLLDVGCGNGRPAVLAAQQTGASVVGINLSTAQIADANKLASEEGVSDKVTFAIADAMELPYPDGSFDAVWAVESLSHMPDRVAALREMLRVLRPGGRLVLTDITERVELKPADKEMMFEAFLMSSIMTHAGYPEAVRAAGFESVQVQDLTAKVNGTLEKVTKTYPERRADVAAAYGEEMAEQLAEGFPALSAVQRNHLGYVVIAASKPAA
jgi:cyclopropane fatty-acyl-phospholipid synthase-like methyltransferase